MPEEAAQETVQKLRAAGYRDTHVIGRVLGPKQAAMQQQASPGGAEAREENGDHSKSIVLCASALTERKDRDENREHS